MPEFAKAVNETNATEGKELLINEVSGKFLDFVQEEAVMSKIFPESPMKTKTREYVKTTGIGSVTWLADDVNGYPVAASAPSYARETVNAWKIMAVVDFTNDWIEDEEFGAIERLVQEKARQVANEIDKAILEGDGSQKFKGILNWTGVVELEKGSPGNNGADLDPTYLSEALTAIRKNHGKADVIVMRPEHVHILRTLKDTNGRYLLDMATYGSPILQEGAVGTVWGLKVYDSANISLDTTSYGSDVTAPIFVLDSRAGEILLRKGLQVKVDDKSLLAYDMTRYVFRMRITFYLGRPEWVAVIKGVKTQ